MKSHSSQRYTVKGGEEMENGRFQLNVREKNIIYCEDGRKLEQVAQRLWNIKAWLGNLF